METAVIKANEIISSFIHDTAHILSEREWYEYGTYAEVDEALRLHRLRKKFCIIDESRADELRGNAIKAFHESNKRSFAKWSVHKWASLGLRDQVVSRARHLVHSLFLDYETGKPDFSKARRQFQAVPDLTFGPGEQYLSYHGDVSHVAKVYCQEWTVTRDCYALAKKAVLKHKVMRRRCLREGQRILGRAHIRQGSLTTREWYSLLFDVGYRKLTRIVMGSRLATVPKNNKTDRLINVEPLLNVGVQKFYGDLLVERLKRVGINLETGQSLHKRLARQLQYATIDFSSASDNYGSGLIEYLFPDFVFEKLMLCRSKFFDDGNGFEKFNVYACMGNATTFPVLTIVTWAFATAIAGRSWVYGDDLIVPQESGVQVMRTMKHYGFRINTEKSFVSGAIRESCGEFAFNGRSLRSYDIRACEEISDIIRTANKVLYNANCSAYPERWLTLWQALSSLVWEYRGPSLQHWDSVHTVVDWLEVPVEVLNADRGSSLARWMESNGYGVHYKVKSRIKKETVIPFTCPWGDLLAWYVQEGSSSNRYRRGAETECDIMLAVNESGQLTSTWKGIKDLRNSQSRLFSRAESERYERWLASAEQERYDRWFILRENVT